MTQQARTQLDILYDQLRKGPCTETQLATAGMHLNNIRARVVDLKRRLERRGITILCREGQPTTYELVEPK